MGRKQFIIISLFIIVSILLGIGLYMIFFRTPPTVTPPTTLPDGTTDPSSFPAAGDAGDGTSTVTPPDQLPTAGAGSRTDTFFEAADVPPVTQRVNSVIGSIDVSGNNVQFYNEVDGKFYRIDEDGNIIELSSNVFFGVDNVTWSPQTNESIIEYPDGSNIYYDFETDRQVTLPAHWEDFSFADQGDQIVAKSVGFDEDNRWLIAADPDGANVQFIEPMGANASKVEVDWSPNRNFVAFSRTAQGQGLHEQKVLLIGQHGENFKSLTVPGRGLTTEWAPDGNQLLYSVYSSRSDFKPELWITGTEVGSIDAGRKPLNLATWADKCTFADERTLYCGVPETLEVGSGFQPAMADTTADNLIKVDLVTGAQERINLDERHTIDTITISADGQTLFFTDKGQPGLFEVSL